MNDRRWYEAEALMADATSRRHAMLGAAEPRSFGLLARRKEAAYG